MKSEKNVQLPPLTQQEETREEDWLRKLDENPRPRERKKTEESIEVKLIRSAHLNDDQAQNSPELLDVAETEPTIVFFFASSLMAKLYRVFSKIGGLCDASIMLMKISASCAVLSPPPSMAEMLSR